jgi:hypothetical protein
MEDHVPTPRSASRSSLKPSPTVNKEETFYTSESLSSTSTSISMDSMSRRDEEVYKRYTDFSHYPAEQSIPLDAISSPLKMEYHNGKDEEGNLNYYKRQDDDDDDDDIQVRELSLFDIAEADLYDN